MTQTDIAIAAAKDFGFESAEFEKTWKGFSVYRCTSKDDTGIIGLPVFVLVDSRNKPHIATADEVCGVLGMEVVHNPGGEKL